MQRPVLQDPLINRLLVLYLLTEFVLLVRFALQEPIDQLLVPPWQTQDVLPAQPDPLTAPLPMQPVAPPVLPVQLETMPLPHVL